MNKEDTGDMSAGKVYEPGNRMEGFLESNGYTEGFECCRTCDSFNRHTCGACGERTSEYGVCALYSN